MYNPRLYRHMFWCGILLALCSFIASADMPIVTPVEYSPAMMEQQGLPVEDAILNATLEQSAVTPGARAYIRLKLCNIGLHTQRHLFTNALLISALAIQDNAGHYLPQKNIKLSDKYCDGHTAVIPLEPKDGRYFDYPLSFVFDLNKCGTYRITAVQRILSKDMEYYCDVVSNAIEIQVTDKVSKDFTLEAPLELPPFTRGDPVILKLYLKNVSKADKTLNINEPMKGYILTLHDIHGKLLLPLMEEKAKVENPIVERLLPAGKIFDSNIDLTNMYDWSKEGRYYLTVMHNVSDNDGQNKMVYSNTVLLSVKSKQVN